MWNERTEDHPAWRASPELYRHLGRRFPKLEAAPQAREVARAAIELSVPDGAHRSRPLWSGDDTVELRQILGPSLARTSNPDDAQKILLQLREEGHVDEETLGMLARTFKDQALQRPVGDPERAALLKRSIRHYREAYERSNGIWTGINVATVERLLGEEFESEKVARRIHAQCLAELNELHASGKAPQNCYWHLATLGEAALNLGNIDEAGRYYREAYEATPKAYGDLSTTRRHARWLLAHWISVGRLKAEDSGLLDDWLPLPRVAVFSGHMLDQPGRSPARFPAQMEAAVRDSIRDWLVANHALIGFSSAACGGDILFQEELQKLGGESRIVLPYEQDQFEKDSVEFAGPDWVRRYREVLQRATSIVTASPHRAQQDGIAYDYANLVLHGLASVRAAELKNEQHTPIGLVLWNGEPGDGLGGTASVVRRWSGLDMQVDQLRLVASDFTGNTVPDRLPIIRSPEPPALVCHGPECTDSDTRIMAMVFGDAVNFSKLDEEQVSRFIQHFMGPIARIVRSYGSANVVRNTWGDGLYLVFDHVRSAGLCALEVCAFVKSQIPDGWRQHGLPGDLNVRIALHAGPVVGCEDPITGQKNYTGTHVSRAARLEPPPPPPARSTPAKPSPPCVSKT